MTFAWPLFLWCLAVPIGLFLWDLSHRRLQTQTGQPNILRAEAGKSSLVLTKEASTTRKRKLRIWCYLGLSLGVVALARPQWGRLDEPVFEQAREILIAQDLSRSMLTPDVKPSRLERSKLLVQSLLDHLQGERVGLAVFSGTAFLQSPLSADYEVLREFLPNLGPDFLPEGGTNYRQLLETSIDAFGSSGAADRFLVILSDGEATDDDWRDEIPKLKSRGIRVIGLGVGTVDGGMIPDGAGAFLKDDTGAVVKSHLESNTLKELAQATGGVYQDASSWVDIAALIHSTIDTGKKGKFTEENTVRLAERFQWALAPAVLLLLISFWKEFPIRPKPRTIELRSTKPSEEQAVRAAVVALFLICVTASSMRAADTAPQAELLGKIVARLASQEKRSALDWSEFAHQTLDWGQHIQSTQQPVPEVPVKDAIAAVSLGRAQDPKVTDWDKLDTDLQALLKKSDQQKPPPPKNDKKDQDKKNDQNKDSKDQQNKSDSSKNDQNNKQDQKQQQKDNQDQSQQQQQNKQQNSGGEPPKNNTQNGQSAFGDLSKDQPPEPPPTPSSGTKPVGGTRDVQPYDPAKADPSLAIPLQKLEQVKNDDSPAELYNLMRKSEPAPPPTNKGKNW